MTPTMPARLLMRRAVWLFSPLVLLLLTAFQTPAHAQGLCYAIAEGDPGLIARIETDGSNLSLIGNVTGSPDPDRIEASAWHRQSATLFVYNKDELGTVDVLTGAYTPIGSFSECTPDGGSAMDIEDADGLSFDSTGNLWAIAEIVSSGQPVFFQVDLSTGLPVANTFGTGDCIPVDDSQTRAMDKVDALAIHPITGVFYVLANDGGGDDDQLTTLNTTTGVLTVIADTTVGPDNLEDVEGLEFDSLGNLFATTGHTGGNPNTLFSIDPSTGVGTPLADLSSLDEDFETLECINEAVSIEKTVYLGHDSGASCPGNELATAAPGADVTYCFTVTNLGDPPLDAVTLSDTDLGITRTDATLLSGTEPLVSGASLTFYYEATLSANLINTAGTSGNPTTLGGTDLPGFTDPTDSDTAEVRVLAASPDINLEKTVYQGHDSGAMCQGSELVTAPFGTDVTYCFVITNTGNTHLDVFTLTDGDLGITITNATLLSGTTPLPPSQSLVYYYETTLTANLLNTANTSADPTDAGGVSLGLPDPTDSDTAEVALLAPNPNISLEKTVYNGHDSGVSCAGLDLATDPIGSNVTYCFELTNTGDTYLDQLTLDDPLLGGGIAITDMTLLSGTLPLAPLGRLVYYYETTITGNLINTASTSGNPTTSDGTDIPGAPNPTDSDDAEVRVPLPAPDIQLDKTVYLGHDNGDQCLGEELVSAPLGSDVTYCFEVTNTGDTWLDQITLDDPDLGLVITDLTQTQGTTPLAPTASLRFYYEATIIQPLFNTANTRGNPTDSAGQDLAGQPDPTDSDPAEVVVPGLAPVSLGNRVFFDEGTGADFDNSVLDAGESGAALVTLRLLTETFQPVDPRQRPGYNDERRFGVLPV